MKYNVFISSKSEDYHLAEQVYNFLKENGLKVFLASRELDRLGEAQYADAIDEALDHTTHMIVVASSVEHIKSKWVKSEWSTFSNDLKSGYRSGNLLNVLTKDIKLKDLPASIRHNQSFTFENYKEHILSYLQEDENELSAKLEAAKQEISHLKDILSDKECQPFKQSDEYSIRIVDNYLEVIKVQQITQILNNFGINVTKNQLLYSLSHLEPCIFSVSTFSDAVNIKKEIKKLGVSVVIENNK